MKPVKIVRACVVAALVISGSLATVSLASGNEGPAGPLLVSFSDPTASTESQPAASSLLAREIGVLTAQGLSPTRARQALGVQGALAKTGLVSKLEAAMGPEFAGVWFDSAAARLHVGVTSAAGLRIARGVVARADLTAYVSETRVRSNWAELSAEQVRWNARVAHLFGLREAETALTPQANAVSVMLSSSVPSSERAALQREAARSRVKVAVEVVPPPSLDATLARETLCNAFATEKAFCDKPITAGVTILFTVKSNKTSYCTGGPLVIEQGTNKSNSFLLTAGHCLEKAGAWYAFNRSNALGKIGTRSSFLNDEFGDYGSILIEPGFWTESGSTPVFAVTARWSVKPLQSSPVTGSVKPMMGATNCHEGATSGESCGTIANVNVAFLFEGDSFTTKGLVEDRNVNEQGGDSGGPWLFVNTAKEIFMEGTHVGGNKGASPTAKAYYEPLETSLGSLKLELLTTANEVRPALGVFNSSTGKLTAKADNVQAFTTAAGKIECSGLSLTEGSSPSGKSTELTVTLQYESCQAFGLKATVSPARYLLKSGGTVSLLRTVTVKATELCTVTLPSAKNQSLSAISYDNVSKRLLVLAKVSGVTSSGAGTACSYAEESKGTYEGSAALGPAGEGTLEWQ